MQAVSVALALGGSLGKQNPEKMMSPRDRER